MRITLTIAISFFSLFSFSQSDSILFLGNSYTSTGDVTGKLGSLASGSGKSLYIESYTPGGKQLSQHYADANSIGKINSHQWDYVVLQEQSQMPLINANTTATYAQKIVLEQVKPNNNCTEVITYMTWARQAGNSWLTQINYTHDQMANYYEDFYEDLWKYVPGRVSPVGKAFHEATRQGVAVYSGDGSHQNTTGAYLSALVFYATIYKESPIGLTYSPLSTELTTQCQQIAHDVVMTDLYEHNILKVNFTMSAVDLQLNETVSYTEAVYMEPFPNQFNWTFEGTQSSASNSENPSGVSYDQLGSHSVTLEITDECGYNESRTFSDTIKVTSPTSVDNANFTILSVYPTILKAGNEFQINNETGNEILNIKMVSLTGKVLNSSYDGNVLKIGNDIATGTYIINVNQKNSTSNIKVLVNR
jgi:hypothetical protein